MFSKFFKLFSLEEKIVASVGAHLQQSGVATAQTLSAFDLRVLAGTQQLDKLEMDLNKRISRLENLLEEELKEKEKLRDELVRSKRLGK